MTLNEILDSLEITAENESPVVVEVLASALGIKGLSNGRPNTRIRAYWVANARSGNSDALVGLRAYYFDGIFVALSRQNIIGEKEHFQWIGTSFYSLVKRHVTTLIEVVDECVTLDMKMEMGDGYQVETVANINGDKVIYKDELYHVKYSWTPPDKMDAGHLVMLYGKDDPVHISDCVVPYHTV